MTISYLVYATQSSPLKMVIKSVWKCQSMLNACHCMLHFYGMKLNCDLDRQKIAKIEGHVIQNSITFLHNIKPPVFLLLFP